MEPRIRVFKSDWVNDILPQYSLFEAFFLFVNDLCISPVSLSIWRVVSEYPAVPQAS